MSAKHTIDYILLLNPNLVRLFRSGSIEPIVSFGKTKSQPYQGWPAPTNALLPGGFLRLGWPFDTGTLSGNVSLGLGGPNATGETPPYKPGHD